MATKEVADNGQNINIISLDLGTKSIIVRVNQRVIFEQPSCIVFDNKDTEVIIGEVALQMKEKAPENKTYKEPMANGVISDSNALIALLTEIFAHETKKENIWKNSVALVAIPSKVYKLDRDTLREIMEGKKKAKILFNPKLTEKYESLNVISAERVVIVPEIKLAAIGAGMPIWGPRGCFILDIGGGTSDAGILASGEVIVQDSVPVAGNAIEHALQSHFLRMHYLDLSSAQAEQAKKDAGIWLTGNKESDNKITVYGKSTKNKQPGKIEVSKSEVAQVVTKAFQPIVDLCKNIIDRAGAAFSEMILKDGIKITGGGALFENIAEHLKRELKLDHVVPANDPMGCLIKGTLVYETHKKELFLTGKIKPST